MRNHRTGLDLEVLKSQAREEARRKQKQEAASLLASFEKADNEPPHAKTRSNPSSNTRKDSSPVKASVFDAVTRTQQY